MADSFWKYVQAQKSPRSMRCTGAWGSRFLAGGGEAGSDAQFYPATRVTRGVRGVSDRGCVDAGLYIGRLF